MFTDLLVSWEMCLQHCPWKGAISLICVRLFLLSMGRKGLYSSSGTPQNSLERHEAIVAGTWSRKKLDVLNSFKILVGWWFFFLSTSAPKEWVSFSQTLTFGCPSIAAADFRTPADFSARALTVLR